MSKLAYHAAHFKSGAVGAIDKHNWEKRGEHDRHSNMDIDPARSHLNIRLLEPPQSLYKALKERLEDCTGRINARSNVLTETIVYPPEDVVERNDPAEIKRYFEDVVEWHQKEFGTANVMAATVHLDETTPHLHTDLIPLTEDGRLSSKEVFARKNLFRHHTELAEFLQERGWDIQRGESTIDKQIRSKSVFEYKKEAEREKHELINEIADLDRHCDTLVADQNAMVENYNQVYDAYVEQEQLLIAAEKNLATVEQQLADKQASVENLQQKGAAAVRLVKGKKEEYDQVTATLTAAKEELVDIRQRIPLAQQKLADIEQATEQKEQAAELAHQQQQKTLAEAQGLIVTAQQELERIRGEQELEIAKYEAYKRYNDYMYTSLTPEWAQFSEKGGIFSKKEEFVTIPKSKFEELVVAAQKPEATKEATKILDSRLKKLGEFGNMQVIIAERDFNKNKIHELNREFSDFKSMHFKEIRKKEAVLERVPAEIIKRIMKELDQEKKQERVK